MARLSDHDTRDAEHALRMEITLLVGRYVRRMNEMGKAYLQEALEEAEKGETKYVDGTAVGRAAADRAARAYFPGLAGAPHQIVEGSTAPAETNTQDS